MSLSLEECRKKDRQQRIHKRKAALGLIATALLFSYAGYSSLGTPDDDPLMGTGSQNNEMKPCGRAADFYEWEADGRIRVPMTGTLASLEEKVLVFDQEGSVMIGSDGDTVEFGDLTTITGSAMSTELSTSEGALVVARTVLQNGLGISLSCDLK